MIATTTRTTTTTARPVTANASRHGATSAARACVGTRGTSDVVRLTSKDAGIARGGAIARARSTMRVHGGRRSVVTCVVTSERARATDAMGRERGDGTGRRGRRRGRGDASRKRDVSLIRHRAVASGWGGVIGGS